MKQNKLDILLNRLSDYPNMFPKGIDTQLAFDILVHHFLPEESTIVSYPARFAQWNSEVLCEILHRYPQGTIRLINPKKSKLPNMKLENGIWRETL